MLNTIIFDMDGTILNTIEDITDSVNYALHQFKLESKSIREIKLAVGNGAKELIARVLKGGYDNPFFDQIYQTYQTYYDAHRMVKTAPYKDILMLLRQLKNNGYKLAVVSNKHDYLVKSLNKQLFEGLFEVAVGETSHRPLKPEPDVIFDVLEMLDTHVESAIFIGDSNVDIITAKNAKMTSVGVTWGFRGYQELKQEGATYMIDEPMMLLDVIKEMN